MEEARGAGGEDPSTAARGTTQEELLVTEGAATGKTVAPRQRNRRDGTSSLPSAAPDSLWANPAASMHEE